ncbi:MAG: HDOD domain-containing protein [candidate division Zixibacteria bacterium]|nr:HDOD domain-containing protein [candidate division Zixibacteria bacterium]
MKESFSEQKEVKSAFDKTEGNLPTPNLVFQEIIHLITDPYSSIYEIVSLISEDPALSFKTLRLVNRSESQKGESLTSVKQALSVLSREEIKTLVLSTYVTPIEQEYQEFLFRHSLACACASRMIGRYLYPHKPLKLDILFTLGLLHDLGKLVIFSSYNQENNPEDNKSVLGKAKKSSNTPVIDHAEISAKFIAKSHLSGVLYQVVRFHHLPRQASSHKEAVMIIHLADYLANLLNVDLEHSSLSPTDEDCWTILGLEKTKILDYLSQLKNEFQKSEVFLRLSEAQN